MHQTKFGNWRLNVCCRDFAHAMEPETDNEMYGPLISLRINGAVSWGIGFDLPTPSFCPWCGEKTKIEVVA